MSESNKYKDEKKPIPQHYSDDPPPYSEVTQSPSTLQYTEGGYPNDSKKSPPPKTWQQPQLQQSNNPDINPNVYVVPPQLVDITRANPQHLNPAYPIYLQKEYERNMQGDFPNPDKYKHGAPLNFSKVPKNKTISKSFPGRAGATYNNAANK